MRLRFIIIVKVMQVGLACCHQDDITDLKREETNGCGVTFFRQLATRF
jgi:hypothetical protein